MNAFETASRWAKDSRKVRAKHEAQDRGQACSGCIACGEPACGNFCELCGAEVCENCQKRLDGDTVCPACHEGKV